MKKFICLTKMFIGPMEKFFAHTFNDEFSNTKVLFLQSICTLSIAFIHTYSY